MCNTDNEKKRVSLIISKPDYEKLKLLCDEKNRSLNNIICIILNNYLKNQDTIVD